MTARRAPSLGRRLLLRLTGVFAFAFVASCAGFLALGWFHPTVEIEGELGELADALAASVAAGPGGAPSAQPDKALADRLGGSRLRHVVIESASGRVLAQSAAPLAPLLPSRTREAGPRMAFSIATRDEPPLRLDGFAVERRLPGGAIVAAVAREQTQFWQPILWVYDELSEDILPVGIPLLIVTLLVAAATIRRTLRPVARLSRQAEAITPRSTGLRLDASDLPDEVLPLVGAFNAALERLDQGFLMQRRFTANAAHQLRTPLAILRARLDGMRPAPETAALKRDCDRIARVVSQLLAIARLDAHEIAIAETVDLNRLARETVAAMAPLAIADGRSLSLDASPAPAVARGNSAALGDALANLIDNALRFSPPGGTVEIAVGPGAALAVLDRGPGVAPAERARVFEPFWRGGDARGPGSGLGLAIVAEIAAAHGGRALVADRPGGGAAFRIELPPIAATQSPPPPALAAQ